MAWSIRLSWAPKIEHWINKSQQEVRNQIINSVEILTRDVKESGIARLGIPKTVNQFEVPITYVRINKELRLIYHIIRQIRNEGDEKIAEILLLDIATKKKNDFQEKASRVSEHLVHGRAIDELTRHVVDNWDKEEALTIDRIRELNNEEKSKALYNPNESDWDEERFQQRVRRAAIFRSSIPDQLILNENGKLASQLKLQGEQNKFRYSERQFWLLDGVAGTGKTTVLLYRYCDIFHKFLEAEGTKGMKTRIQFVTHNPLLKEEMIQQLSEIIPDPEVRHHAESCIITLKEFFDQIFKEAIIATIRQQFMENIDGFLGTEKTKELHFTIIYSKNKTKISSEMSIKRIEAYQGNFEAFIPRGRWEERIPSDSHILLQSSVIVQKIKNEQGEEKPDVRFNEQLTPNLNKLNWIDLVFPEKKRFNRTKYQSCLERLNIQDLDSDLYFEEFRGIIRGYNSTQEEQILTLEEYLTIGAKRGRIERSLRPEIHEISKRVFALWDKNEHWGRLQGGWDNLDIRRVLEKIQARTEISSLDAIFIDEVQDLSHCDMHTVLKRLDDGGMFSATGDLAQSVQPSSFTWNDLRAQITEIHGERPKSEFFMAENFRSTPNLVEVANKILGLQQEVRGVVNLDLQKPYATAQGDQVLIFKRNQENLISILNKYSLPNTSCPLLVRDNETKEFLKTKLSKSNIDFIFTISEFKGMEKTSVLLYDVASGSSRFLDRYFSETRGKKAQMREYGNNTALLELRHAFVGMTRARFQMGLLTANNHSEFIDHLVKITEKSYLNPDVDDDRIEAFKTDGLTPEEYVEQAKIYERKKLYDAAASNWENAKREADALRCRSMNKDGEFKDYNKAIQAIGKAIEEGRQGDGKWPQFWLDIKNELPEMGSEYSDQIYAIAIRIGDREGLLQSRATELEASKDYEKAYKLYLKINDEEQANRVFQKLKPAKQIALLSSPEIGEEDRARALFWELIYDGKYPKGIDDKVAYLLMSKDSEIIKEISRIYGFDLAPENQDINFERFYDWVEGRRRFKRDVEKLQLKNLENKVNKSENEYNDLFRLSEAYKRTDMIREIAELKSDYPIKRDAIKYLDENDPYNQIKKIIDSDDPTSENIRYDVIFESLSDSMMIIRSLNQQTCIDYIKKIEHLDDENLNRFNLLVFVSVFFDKQNPSRASLMSEIIEEIIYDTQKKGLWRLVHEFTDFSRESDAKNLVGVLSSRDILLWRQFVNKIDTTAGSNILNYLMEQNGSPCVYLLAIYCFADKIAAKQAGKMLNQISYQDKDEKYGYFIWFCWRFGYFSKEDRWKIDRERHTERARRILNLGPEAFTLEISSNDVKFLSRTNYEDMTLELAKFHYKSMKAKPWSLKEKRMVEQLLPEFNFRSTKNASKRRKQSRRKTKYAQKMSKKAKDTIDEAEPDLDRASILQNLGNTSEIETTIDYEKDARQIIESADKILHNRSADNDPYDELIELIGDFVTNQPVDLLARLDALALEQIHFLSTKFSQKEYLEGSSIVYASMLSPDFMSRIEISTEQYNTLSSSKDFKAIDQLIQSNIMQIQHVTPKGWKKTRKRIR